MDFFIFVLQFLVSCCQLYMQVPFYFVLVFLIFHLHEQEIHKFICLIFFSSALSPSLFLGDMCTCNHYFQFIDIQFKQKLKCDISCIAVIQQVVYILYTSNNVTYDAINYCLEIVCFIFSAIELNIPDYNLRQYAQKKSNNKKYIGQSKKVQILKSHLASKNVVTTLSRIGADRIIYSESFCNFILRHHCYNYHHHCYIRTR